MVRLVNVVSHDVVWAVVLGVAEYLDLLRVGDHDALTVELEGLPEPLHSPLAKANVLMTKLSLRLEQRCHRAAIYNLDIDGLVLLGLADRSCRSLIIVFVITGVERSHVVSILAILQVSRRPVCLRLICSPSQCRLTVALLDDNRREAASHG